MRKLQMQICLQLSFHDDMTPCSSNCDDGKFSKIISLSSLYVLNGNTCGTVLEWIIPFWPKFII